ncbi:UNVERIFIED_CONTAM: hypothetical protein NCL1_32991 [Trichonephila clavipes]
MDPNDTGETKNLQQLKLWNEWAQENFMAKNDPKLSFHFKYFHVFLHCSHLSLILLLSIVIIRMITKL